MSLEQTWIFGWFGILLAFVSGMLLGLVTKSDSSFLGDYSDHRRRFVRLGHIAMAALGMINVLFALSRLNGLPGSDLSGLLLAVGLISMPIVCFIYAFVKKAFLLFTVPSVSLAAAVVLLIGEVLSA